MLVFIYHAETQAIANRSRLRRIQTSMECSRSRLNLTFLESSSTVQMFINLNGRWRRQEWKHSEANIFCFPCGFTSAETQSHQMGRSDCLGIIISVWGDWWLAQSVRSPHTRCRRVTKASRRMSAGKWRPECPTEDRDVEWTSSASTSGAAGAPNQTQSKCESWSHAFGEGNYWRNSGSVLSTPILRICRQQLRVCIMINGLAVCTFCLSRRQWQRVPTMFCTLWCPLKETEDLC